MSRPFGRVYEAAYAIDYSRRASFSDFLSDSVTAFREDVRKASRLGCGFYYCPSNFLGTDYFGNLILKEFSFALDDAVRDAVGFLRGFGDMSFVLGYRDGVSRGMVALVVSCGEVVANDGVAVRFRHNGRSVAACAVRGDLESCAPEVGKAVAAAVPDGADIVFLVGMEKYVNGTACSATDAVGRISAAIGAEVVYRLAFCPFACDSDCYEDITLRVSGGVREARGCDDAADGPSPECDFSRSRLPLVESEGREELLRDFGRVAKNVACRMKAAGIARIVLGLSGGVDSAAALLIAADAVRLLGFPAANVTAVSMPCFGTSGLTRGNSRLLAEAIGADFREIDITGSVASHLADIGRSTDVRDVVYENAQARERTQVLLDLANELHALELGTGDLSESVLGWCTFGGDQTAMYNVNLGFSKTQLRFILSETARVDSLPVLDSIVSTPVSPELLPPDSSGNISQRTEDIIGPYEVIDHCIYSFFVRGSGADRCIENAKAAFGGVYPLESIEKWTRGVLRRFASSSFKRQSVSPCPIVTRIGKSVFSGSVPGSLPFQFC